MFPNPGRRGKLAWSIHVECRGPGRPGSSTGTPSEGNPSPVAFVATLRRWRRGKPRVGLAMAPRTSCRRGNCPAAGPVAGQEEEAPATIWASVGQGEEGRVDDAVATCCDGQRVKGGRRGGVEGLVKNSSPLFPDIIAADSLINITLGPGHEFRPRRALKILMSALGPFYGMAWESMSRPVPPPEKGRPPQASTRGAKSQVPRIAPSQSTLNGKSVPRRM